MNNQVMMLYDICLNQDTLRAVALIIDVLT